MRKIKEESKVAAKNTTWRYIWLRAIYLDGPNTLECAIFHESLMCAYYVRHLLIEMLHEDHDTMLLNLSPECILRKYSIDYPELCLILLNLGQFGPLSPLGLDSDFVWRSEANYVFGASCDSPLYRTDFYLKNIPVIRITDSVFTIGTNQPQFLTIDDVKNYYRDEGRIEEIARMCMRWVRKFYSYP